jgi:hypothetical protein
MDILGSIDISSLMTYLKPPSFNFNDNTAKSDVELEESLAYRTEKRGVVIEEINRFPPYEKYLTAAKVASGKIKEYETFLTTELAWWDDKNNYNKDKKTYRIRISQFMDTIENRRKTLQVLATEQLSSMDPKEAQEIMSTYKEYHENVPEFFEPGDADPNATPYTIAKQVLWDILPWIKFAFFLFVAFRLASITANELLYKHISYRILAFAYIFYYVLYSSTFSIPIILYYLYKEYSRFLFHGTMDYPIYYSAFPMQRVVSMDNPPVYDKWYQYPHTADEWIKRKQQDVNESMLLAVQGTKDILRSLMTQGGNVKKMQNSLQALATKVGGPQGIIKARLYGPTGQGVGDAVRLEGAAPAPAQPQQAPAAVQA